jgi:two-component system, cell cycle sensor histidine kinase and response regulator CckA
MAERMSDTRWKALFETEPDALLVVAGDGALREVNPAGLLLFEAERPTEVVGRTLSEFLAPSHREAFRSYVKRVRGGHKGSLEVEMAGLKGGARTVMVWAVPLDKKPGSGASLLVLARDVTEQRELEADLRESRKMAAVGQLAASFAHDFNNLLNGLMGSLWLVATKLGADHPAAPLVGTAGQAGRKAAEVVRQLLAIGRKSKGELYPVALQPIAEEVVRRLRRTLDPRIEVVLEADPDLGTVQSHPGLIRTILLNLCTNARDAMPQGGRLTVELSNVKKEDIGECVRLTVSDTGVGMDAELSRRIFEPFFTTKEERRGIGLGLTVVQSLVNRLGGTITVESEPGRGSRFVIDVPRMVAKDAPVELSPAEPPAHAVPSGTGQAILVVDDEEILRVVARAALEQAGFAVLEAEDSASALEVFQRERERIAVVLLDVNMPGRTGEEFFQDLRGLDPKVSVIFCSGSISEKKGVLLTRAGAKAFLHKPYSARQLTEAVRQVLQPQPKR